MENFSSYFGDIVSYALLNGAEYFILGQHFINTDRKDDPNGLEFINAFEPFDDEERLIKAVDAVVEAVNSGYISIVAHPDHINFIGDEQIYRREMRRICDACIENGVYAEINCLGIRSHRHYPNEKFWRLAGETGVKVVYGFDAHDPLSAYDGESIPKMLALVEKYNLNFEKNPTLKLFNR
jgi:histidinol-phosphatase (PHP family)